MHDTFGNDEALPGVESYQAIFEIDQELALDYVKKLVVLVMFVPMVFTLNNAEANDGVIHLTERLVEPLVNACVGEGFLVDDLQGLVIKV